MTKKTPLSHPESINDIFPDEKGWFRDIYPDENGVFQVDDGLDIYPDENGVFHVVSGERLTVKASAMQVPTDEYVFI